MIFLFLIFPFLIFAETIKEPVVNLYIQPEENSEVDTQAIYGSFAVSVSRIFPSGASNFNCTVFEYS